jgi:peptidoglycan DL-endopeptidase CwlO
MPDSSVLDRTLRCGRHLLPVAVVACLAVPAATAADTPAIKAKRAEAKQVIAQINAIDERLSVVTEHYDGARVHLQAIESRLETERSSLSRARVANKHAQDRAAALLVSIYEAGRPSALEAILGAKSIDEMLTATDAAAAISREDDSVVDQATRARLRLQHAVAALRTDRTSAARALRQLDRSRATIEAGLAERQQLLKSVQGQLAHLEAVERARQARLAALARARLAAEARARARAAAAAVAAARQRRIAAAQAAAAAAAAATTTAATQTTDDAVTPPPAAVTDSTATTTVPSLNDVPTVLPPGHPEAATIALGYIGVPYLWGGESPAGFDCSGLVSYVFAQLGIDLPHFAADQYTFGVPVPEDELQPGDLVFFNDLDHVGIYIGAGELVDAPHTGTFVRIDNLSDGWYAKHYVGARRI